MANIFIDPVIVMTPPDNTNREGIEVWLANLDIWLQEALSGHFIWLHAIEVTQLLEGNGRFPNFAILRALQQQYRLDINPTQTARKINEFFRNPAYDLGESLANLEFLVELQEGSTNIQPFSIVARWPDFIHDTMHLLLATTCASNYKYDFAKEMRFATVALTDGTKEIVISAVVSYAIPDFVRDADNTITHSFPLLLTPDDLLPLIDVIELWNEGESGIRYAIEQEYKKIWHKTIVKPMAFRFGPAFMKSIIDAGLDTNRTVLQRIIRMASDVIAGKDHEISGFQRHPLRENEGATSPQCVRSEDNAKAWRLDIMKSGAGWRMHYWRIPDAKGDVIEFSNVQKESGTKII
jgi:hypothetical protein